MADTSDHLPHEGEAVDRATSLEVIEQDLDTVDAALSALDSDDLERAEALAAELEGPRAGSLTRSAEQSKGSPAV